jgi:hypothetical protein
MNTINDQDTLKNGNMKKRNFILFLPLLIALAFFFFAPVIQRQMAKRNSNLSVYTKPLPAVTDAAKMYIDHLQISDFKSNEYSLHGWGFLTHFQELTPTEYERTLLLISDAKIFSLSTSEVIRTDVQKAFQDLDLDLTYSGFNTSFSLYALPPGKYLIAMVFSLTDGTEFLFYSDFVLNRTVNSLKLIQVQ